VFTLRTFSHDYYLLSLSNLDLLFSHDWLSQQLLSFCFFSVVVNFDLCLIFELDLSSIKLK